MSPPLPRALIVHNLTNCNKIVGDFIFLLPFKSRASLSLIMTAQLELQRASNRASHSKERILNYTVLVSGLGYFVDIYDLLLFGIVRVASLKGMGVPESEFLRVGIYLVNFQMIGMLVGGVVWGMIGDKRGRVSVLFGSILIYSAANILNAFVSSVDMYGLLRFIAGFGLAGELGAAITLVTETMGKEKRGYGTTLVAAIGILGAVCAGIIGDLFNWRTCYLIGGGMGLLLLVMRLSVFESTMFKATRKLSTSQKIRRGDVRMLFYPWPRFIKYIRCILIGVPIWFAIGITITFSPELAKEMGVTGPVSAGRAILFSYLGASIGNLICGLLSQRWKSRKKATFAFLLLLLFFVGVTLFSNSLTPFYFYTLCVLIGLGTGYWTVFMTIAAEQFGTNLRATATTTVPNFVRASVVVLTICFHELGKSIGMIYSAWAVGCLTIAIAVASLYWMRETFGEDLNFTE